MEQATQTSLVNVGAAGILVLALLKIIFDYLKNKEVAENKESEQPEDCFGIEEQRMLNVMAVQLAEIHTTVMVTQIFQKSLITLAENQTQQTEILKEVVVLNHNITEILERMTRWGLRREKEEKEEKEREANKK